MILTLIIEHQLLTSIFIRGAPKNSFLRFDSDSWQFRLFDIKPRVRIFPTIANTKQRFPFRDGTDHSSPQVFALGFDILKSFRGSRVILTMIIEQWVLNYGSRPNYGSPSYQQWVTSTLTDTEM